jgi:hypothetical protein
MARTASQTDHNDGARLAGCAGLGAQAQNVGKAQTSQPEGADAQKIAPIDTVAETLLRTP